MNCLIYEVSLRLKALYESLERINYRRQSITVLSTT